jgi:hypothetical protein
MENSLTYDYSGACHFKAVLAGLLALNVSLCLAQTPTGTTTRVEENDPSITYGGTWIPDNLGDHSAGKAILSNQSGARVSLTFTGTGISWIGTLTGASREFFWMAPSISWTPIPIRSTTSRRCL